MTSIHSLLPQSIGKVARRELAINGIVNLQQVAEKTDQELLAIHGVGPKAVRILREIENKKESI